MPIRFRSLLVMALVMVGAPLCMADGFDIGGAAAYGIIFTGGGHNTLQVTNVSVTGDVGVGGTGLMTDSGPSAITGEIDFSAANTGQFTNNNGADTFTGVTFGDSTLTSILTQLESLNTSLGAEAGTNVAINGSTTINATSGTLDASGNYVFNVSSFNTTNGNTLTINGAAGQHVVLNFTGSTNFNNQVLLTGGINAGDVLYNFVGGSNLTNGPTLQINDNISNNTANCSLGIYCVQGLFLDPNGAVSVVNSNVLGGVFGGDSHDFQYVSGSAIDSPGMATPEPSSILLLIIGLLAIVALARRKNASLAELA